MFKRNIFQAKQLHCFRSSIFYGQRAPETSENTPGCCHKCIQPPYFTIGLYTVCMNSQDMPCMMRWWHVLSQRCVIVSCSKDSRGRAILNQVTMYCVPLCMQKHFCKNMLQHLLFLATLVLRTNSLDLSGYGSVRRAVCLIVQKGWNKELKVYQWSQLDYLSCVVLSLTSSELRPLQVHQQEMGLAKGKFSMDLLLDTEEAIQSKIENHATVTADQQQEFVFSHLRKVCKVLTQMEEVRIESVAEKTRLPPP